ncbi:MAG: KamA family radical SAM protein [Betaproteobacteria bacterium]|nr:KamA family radical SAM protein [Betaproteobacteria bacterium]
MKYISRIDHIPQLTESDKAAMRLVEERYVFRATDYYLKLIDWDDPRDPIRQLILPRIEELNDWGRLDASDESANTVGQGIQHKYPDTALLLCNEVCGGYCRYCFRKRLFMDGNDEVSKDVSAGIAYIAAHPEISNVLLTGGDPLIMSTRRLSEIIAALRRIPHVRVIRLGSKMPAFNPARILDDDALLEMLALHSTADKRIYLMAHFDHPRELTDTALRALDRLTRSGVILTNQCPIIRGVNDDAAVLSELFRRLSWIGCTPYYLFQGRPTSGNDPYRVPIVEGWYLFQAALSWGAGLARRARFVMSHASGKIEILMVDDAHIHLRYHRAKNPAHSGRLLVCERDDEACWLDELKVLKTLPMRGPAPSASPRYQRPAGRGAPLRPAA